MLNETLLRAVTLTVVNLRGHSAECHYPDSHSDWCYSNECHYAESHSDWSYSAKCRSACCCSDIGYSAEYHSSHGRSTKCRGAR
jgi:hypothetical protein